jgi:hypothetical protein
MPTDTARILWDQARPGVLSGSAEEPDGARQQTNSVGLSMRTILVGLSKAGFVVCPSVPLDGQASLTRHLTPTTSPYLPLSVFYKKKSKYKYKFGWGSLGRGLSGRTQSPDP